MDKEAHYISPDQLRVGLYIHLDLGWMDHPFTFSNFKIKTEEQLAQIRTLKLEKLRYDPYRSDGEPLALSADKADEAPAIAAPVSAEMQIALEQATRNFHQQRLHALHEAMHECERAFNATAGEAKRIEREIHQNPQKSLHDAQVLVGSMVDSLLAEGDIALHSMQNNPGAVDQYLHPLNVTVLALILAKSLDMTDEEASCLGLGCLFHDIGKSQIPDRVLLKTEPLTRAESMLIQQHPEFGVQFARESGMPDAVIRIIQQHHECSDGSGYPAGLRQDQIDPLVRIVSVANVYDNLCNPANAMDAMTPYEALAHMFARMRSKFDADILKQLIKNLGVYPPGSLVQLSDNSYGLVASVNPSKPLRPHVLLYAPDVPREKPLLLNLGDDPALSISRCLRQAQLPKDVLHYLSPGKRLCYFFQKEHLDEEPPIAQ
jgi:putative nucleotidyltransferase with HDIG domain